MATEPPVLPQRRSSATSWLIDAGILLLASSGTYYAVEWDRPITGVVTYLTAVILIGARSGLRRGIAAALIASFVYNFFLSDPRFRLGITSLDEVVPLVAFNVCAIVSGGLAGRLRDAANAARSAEAKNALLLAISDELQRAVSVADVGRIAGQILPLHGVEIAALGIWRSDPAYASVHDHETLVPLIEERGPAHEGLSLDLAGSRGDLGRVTLRTPTMAIGDTPPVDLRAVANLLAMALDRCLLLEQLSETMALQRSEELKNALLSSVSHDLRTPLTAIEASATSLRSFRGNLAVEQQDEMLGTIIGQCEKLNRYTANLLDMGRIQAGIAPEQFTTVDLVEILGVALGSIRARFPDQPVAKQVPLDSALVHANAPMLEQVIVNVLENAVVHGGAGQPITVEIVREQGVFHLAISDSGPGVEAAERSKVFERFYRGRDGVRREGSGLGLYIARGFVEAFGGTIALGSAESGGAKVSVRLPVATA